VPEVGPDDRLCVDLAYSARQAHPEEQDRARRRLAERTTLDSGLSAAYRLRSVVQSIPLQSDGLASLCSVADVCADPCARVVGARWSFEPREVADREVATGQFRRVRDLGDPPVTLLEDRIPTPYSAVLPAHPYTDPWATIVALHDRRLQPGAQALVAAADLPPGAFPGRGTAPARRVLANRVEVETHADLPGILVVREGYSADWHATVDGAAARIVPADLGLLGIPVAGGPHRVLLEFVPWGWPAALTVWAVTLALCVVLMLTVAAARRPRART
jgi:hypothetical protein